jgi:hypothetical protein
MTGTYANAAIIVAASIAVGSGLRPGTMMRWCGWEAGVGFAALVTLTALATRLPGRTTTAAVAAAVTVAGALVRSRRRAWSTIGDAVPTAMLALGLASIPFIVADRIGGLGQGVLDDLPFHLLFSRDIAHGTTSLINQPGYPLGAHALVATLGSVLGTDAEEGFLGLLLAVPVLTALTALDLLDGFARPIRVLIASVAGIPYMGAAYLVQGAFKEPILALLLLALVALLSTVVAGRTAPLQAAPALGLLGAAAVYVYTYAALSWLALIVPVALGVEVLARRAGERRAWLRTMVVAVGTAAGLTAVLIAPEVPRMLDFLNSPAGGLSGTGLVRNGNFPGQISWLQGFGIWLHADYLIPPTSRLTATYALGFVGLALTILAVALSIRRRDLVLPTAVAAGLLIYAIARATRVPYVSTKSLAVIAPAITVLVARGLLFARPKSRSVARWAWAGCVAAFLLLSAVSSMLVLRAAHVRNRAQVRDLALFRPMVQGASVLYLANDNYAQWDLRGSRLTALSGYGPRAQLNVRPQKAGPAAVKYPLDFDSVDPAALDRFSYVITPRSAFGSQPPSTLRPLRVGRWYELWKRFGPTPPRAILHEGVFPGAVMQCARNAPPPSNALLAFVREPPVVGHPYDWRPLPGGSFTQLLPVSGGTWEIDLEYLSRSSVAVSLGTSATEVRSSIPAQLGDVGSLWRIGELTTSRGPLSVTVRPTGSGVLDSAPTPAVGAVAATRVDAQARRLVVGRAACGQYVDWLTLKSRRG